MAPLFVRVSFLRNGKVLLPFKEITKEAAKYLQLIRQIFIKRTAI